MGQAEYHAEEDGGVSAVSLPERGSERAVIVIVKEGEDAMLTEFIARVGLN